MDLDCCLGVVLPLGPRQDEVQFGSHPGTVGLHAGPIPVDWTFILGGSCKLGGLLPLNLSIADEGDGIPAEHAHLVLASYKRCSVVFRVKTTHNHASLADMEKAPHLYLGPCVDHAATDEWPEKIQDDEGWRLKGIL